MAVSPASTIPFTPSSFADDLDIDEAGEEIFALLRPLNPSAKDAFSAVIVTLLKHPEDFKSIRPCIHAAEKRTRATSIDSQQDSASNPGDDDLRWEGVYKLGLKYLPQSPGEGWKIGTSPNPSPVGVDLLLAPPEPKWQNRGLSSNHARIFLHRQSYRVVLEAQHTTIVTWHDTSVIREKNQRVLEHGACVQFGDYTYAFEHTNHFRSRQFEKPLSSYMKDFQSGPGLLNTLIAPGSVSSPISLGRYLCSPIAFGKGSFGKVYAGWHKGNGRAVAIKTIKEPVEKKLLEHEGIMKHIGYHSNLLQLSQVISDFSQIPQAHCIYTPLATTTLSDAVKSFNIDDRAMSNLARDYLRGLSFLHEEKRLIHRDLTPSNLAIVSLQEPRGIIIDLDSLTRNQQPEDHRVGTIPFLAPEIIRLKAWDEEGRTKTKPAPLDRSADVWAMGLCLYTLYFGRWWTWSSVEPDLKVKRQSGLPVSLQRWKAYSAWIGKDIQDTPSSIIRQRLGFIRDMTVWGSGKRPSALEMLNRMQALGSSESGGSIEPKKSKRDHGE